MRDFFPNFLRDLFRNSTKQNNKTKGKLAFSVCRVTSCLISLMFMRVFPYLVHFPALGAIFVVCVASNSAEFPQDEATLLICIDFFFSAFVFEWHLLKPSIC